MSVSTQRGAEEVGRARSRVLVRADASPGVGGGHVARCRVLARALRRLGAEVVFVTRSDAGTVARLETDGFGVLPLAVDGPEEGWLPVTEAVDAQEMADVVGDGSFDWLVLDGYGFGKSWFEQWNRRTEAVLAIDDLADRNLACDVLVDPSPEPAVEERYRHLVPPSTRLLCGPRFALVDERFAEAEGGPVDPPEVLVYFGSADATGVTERAVQGALDASPDVRVVAVLGPSHPREAVIRSRFGSHGRVDVLGAVDDVAERMRRSTLVVSAGGTITFERCAIGRAGVVATVAANQERLAAALAEKGTQVLLGRATDVAPGRVTDAVSTLLADAGKREQLGVAGRALVDGRGALRVASTILMSTMRVRPATLDDARLAHQWREHPDVRGQFFDPRPVPWEEHQRWFAASLADKDRLLLVGTMSESPIGIVRFDVAGGVATVSIYLDPDLLGLGLGSSLLAVAVREVRTLRPEVRECRAEVLPGNDSSRRLFENAGFTTSHVTYVLDVTS